MAESFHKGKDKSSAWIEKGMKRISLGISLSSLGLMISGFVLLFFSKHPDLWPGAPALPVKGVLTQSQRPLDLIFMSLGIVLLGLLPAARLLLAVAVYLRWGDLKNVLVAMAVLLELLLSLRLSL